MARKDQENGTLSMMTNTKKTQSVRAKLMMAETFLEIRKIYLGTLIFEMMLALLINAFIPETVPDFV